jgi:hypothetical protein
VAACHAILFIGRERSGGRMDREREQNLIIVASLDNYALQQGISLREAALLFKQYDVFEVLRNNYETLHTQDLSEGACFARDYISRVSHE